MGARTSLDDDPMTTAAASTSIPPSQEDMLQPLLMGRSVLSRPNAYADVVIGELIAITDEGETPLVLFPGQSGAAALRARSVVDLHAAHIGRPVVLAFEGGDPALPIVMGVLKAARHPAAGTPGPVQLEVDGERLVVSAAEQLVLRCGKASITLTQAGKVLIQGSYVSSRSSGVNRIKGGSVQLN